MMSEGISSLQTTLKTRKITCHFDSNTQQMTSHNDKHDKTFSLSREIWCMSQKNWACKFQLKREYNQIMESNDEFFFLIKFH